MAAIIAHEKLQKDATDLSSELSKLTEAGKQLLADPQAIPSAYSGMANEFDGPMRETQALLSADAARSEEPVIAQLSVLFGTAEEVQTNLSDRSHLWTRFANERDSATDQLEAVRSPIDTIESKPLRSSQEVAEDMNLLKVPFKIILLVSVDRAVLLQQHF